MTTRNYTATGNSATDSATFINEHNNVWAAGDVINLNGDWDINLGDNWTWNKGLTIRAQKGADYAHPYHGNQSCFFNRRVTFTVMAWCAITAGQTMRMEYCKFKRPVGVWPDWFGAGQTWPSYWSANAGKPQGIFYANGGDNRGAWQMIGCEGYVGYGTNVDLYSETTVYPDFDSPGTYYCAQPGNVADTLGRVSAVQDGSYPYAFSVGGHNDPSPRNQRGNLLYNPVAASPNIFGIYFHDYYDEDCYWHDSANGHGLLQDSTNSKLSFESHATCWERIYLFSAQVGRIRNGTTTGPIWWDRPISWNLLGHPQDLMNPHADDFYPLANNQADTTARRYRSRITKGIVGGTSVKRGPTTGTRNQPNPSYNPGIRALGHEFYYNFYFENAGYQFDIHAEDADIVGNVMVKARHFTPISPGGGQTGEIHILRGDVRVPETVGRIAGNITESFNHDTASKVTDNINIAGNESIATANLVAPSAAAPDIETLYQNHRLQTGSSISNAYRNPYSTVAALRASADLSSIPAHAAPPKTVGAVANTLTTSSMFFKHGGNDGDTHTFVPGSGLEWREMDYDGVTQTRSWSSSSGPATTGRLLQVRATSSATPNAVLAKSYTLDGVQYTWNLITATANKWPGATCRNTRLIKSPLSNGLRRIVNAVDTRIASSKKGSFFAIFSNGQNPDAAGTNQYMVATLPAGIGDGGPGTQINPQAFYSGAGNPTGLGFAIKDSVYGALGDNVYPVSGSGLGPDTNDNTILTVACSWDLDANTKQFIINGVDRSGSMTLNTGKPSPINWDIWTLFESYTNGNNPTSGADFCGTVYALGFNPDNFVDWNANGQALYNLLANPDGVGPRFNVLDPNGLDWPIAVVGDYKRINGGTANLNSANVFVPDGGTRNGNDAFAAATDKGVAGAVLPGTHLVLTATVQTAKPIVGQPVDILVTFSGANIETLLVPTWDGVARTGATGNVTAAAVSNGVVFSATPTAAGYLTFSLYNDQGHTPFEPLTIPVGLSIPFTISPAAGYTGTALSTSIRLLPPPAYGYFVLGAFSQYPTRPARSAQNTGLIPEAWPAIPADADVFGTWRERGVNTIIGYDEGNISGVNIATWDSTAKAKGLKTWRKPKIKYHVNGVNGAFFAQSTLQDDVDDKNMTAWTLQDEPDYQTEGGPIGGQGTIDYVANQITALGSYKNQKMLFQNLTGHNMGFFTCYPGISDVSGVHHYPALFNMNDIDSWGSDWYPDQAGTQRLYSTNDNAGHSYTYTGDHMTAELDVLTRGFWDFRTPGNPTVPLTFGNYNTSTHQVGKPGIVHIAIGRFGPSAGQATVLTPPAAFRMYFWGAVINGAAGICYFPQGLADNTGFVTDGYHDVLANQPLMTEMASCHTRLSKLIGAAEGNVLIDPATGKRRAFTLLNSMDCIGDANAATFPTGVTPLVGNRLPFPYEGVDIAMPNGTHYRIVRNLRYDSAPALNLTSHPVWGTVNMGTFTDRQVKCFLSTAPTTDIFATGVEIAGSGLVASDTFSGNPITLARDANNSTTYSGDGTSNPWTLTIPLKSAARLRYIAEILRTSAPEQGFGQFTVQYSDDGTHWVEGSGGTISISGYNNGTYTAGTTHNATLPNDGEHRYWRITVTKRIDGASMPNAVAFAEIIFATDVGATQLIV